MRTQPARKLTQILGIVLCALSFIIPDQQITANAESPETVTQNIQLGSEVLRKNCNTGKAARVHMGNNAYASWRVIGYENDGILSSSDTITFISDNIITYGSYASNDRQDNYYSTSNLKSLMSRVEERFSFNEVRYIKPVDLNGYSDNYGAETYKANNISGPGVANAPFWPLSVEEANMLNDDLLLTDTLNPQENKASWWLRTPGLESDKAAFVQGNGIIVAEGASVHDESSASYGVRPAFEMEKKDILFVSAVDGGKDSSYDGILRAPQKCEDTEMKITFATDDIAVDLNGDINRWYNTISVPYKCSIHLDTLSIFITDKKYNEIGAKILYYGHLKPETDFYDNTGIATFELPGDYDTSWKVYLLAEVIYEEGSDFSSRPLLIDIPKLHQKPLKNIATKSDFLDYCITRPADEMQTLNFAGTRWYVINYKGVGNIAGNPETITLLSKES
nr:DUF6273 domain-containing protein [Lachnospiraceae bacterium]